MKPAYYNEIDKYAAEWLRNLIAAGHIAPGDVDERSIEDVKPDDLRGYAQCHFFAGVGVWSLALRRAGWPDHRRVWTGSCPCQPFSAAGKGAGFADERHLWPAFFHLIAQCSPERVYGEQVAGSDVGPWIDLVHSDMEAVDYAFGAVPFPSAGVGAPHIRDRMYWVADSAGAGLVRRRSSETSDGSGTARVEPERLRTTRVVGVAHDAGSQRRVGVPERADQCASRSHGVAGSLADDDDGRQQRFASLRVRGSDLYDPDGRGPVGGFWADAEWIACRDGKWRPVEPGTFPLAHGAPARVGRLRAYGNAINAQAAEIFVRSTL